MLPDPTNETLEFRRAENARKRIAQLERENAELRKALERAKEDSALLDAFDLAGRQDDVRGRQISETECEQELVGHFWTTPTVQSCSCREAIRAACAPQI